MSKGHKNLEGEEFRLQKLLSRYGWLNRDFYLNMDAGDDERFNDEFASLADQIRRIRYHIEDLAASEGLKTPAKKIAKHWKPLPTLKHLSCEEANKMALKCTPMR